MPMKCFFAFVVAAHATLLLSATKSLFQLLFCCSFFQPRVYCWLVMYDMPPCTTEARSAEPKDLGANPRLRQRGVEASLASGPAGKGVQVITTILNFPRIYARTYYPRVMHPRARIGGRGSVRDSKTVTWQKNNDFTTTNQYKKLKQPLDMCVFFDTL